jgi:hypothetical protein
MADPFQVEHLDIERLLADWRWLCPQPVTLVARNAFGDLFLRDDKGKVLWLSVAEGKLTNIAPSVAEFRELLNDSGKRAEWLAETDAQAASERGLNPDQNQCIGFATPLVFAESGATNTPYLADLYDHVGFLGDLHRQLLTLPEGAKVRLRVEGKPQ